MRFYAIAFLAISATANAQVNLCLDGQGRKTYTEAECSELGMEPAGVIKDIKPKSKHCYDLEAMRDAHRNNAARARAIQGDMGMGKSMAVISDGEADRVERQYKKECKR